MSKHTRVSWAVIESPVPERTERLARVVSMGGFGGVYVAEVYGSDTHETDLVSAAEANANANMLAAAPELLAALEELLDISVMEDQSRWRINDAEDTARAVIAKAKGETA